MNDPEVIHCDENELKVKVRRCPLKDAWRMSGLTDDEVADMCEHADSFDHVFFGSYFNYQMDLWSEQPDDSCILTFRSRKK